MQIETYSELLLDARKRTDPNCSEWHPGAIAWFLTSTACKGACRLENITVSSTPSPPADLILRQEKLTVDLSEDETKVE